MKPLKVDDKEFFKEPTTLTAEQIDISGKKVLQLAMYDNPQLDGFGIFLTRDKVVVLYKWLRQFLGD